MFLVELLRYLIVQQLHLKLGLELKTWKYYEFSQVRRISY